MIKIQDSFLENHFLDNTPDTIFTMLMREVDPLGIIDYSKKYYIHGLLKYPKWESDSDLFQYLKEENLKLLVSGEAYFIFDASTEGFSPIYGEPFFDLLYYNCEKYNVDPENIIFVSANLKDEENIIHYSKEKNKIPLKVFCFSSFEKVVGMHQNKSAEELLKEEKVYSQKFYKSKYFSSLSRVNRPHRTFATFVLCQDEIFNNALISHDKFPPIGNFEGWKNYNMLNSFKDSQIKDWLEKLPLTIDQQDFSKNWALNTDFSNIHRQTLFQIVNETLVDDKYQTSLFYSEKTFRPILHFQPFLIFGQPGINHYILNLGYKTYEDWFDLSFDFIENHEERYIALLNSVKQSIDTFKNLSKDNQILWRYKNDEVLLHNYKTMINGNFVKDKLKNFLKTL